MAQHGSLPRWACVAFCARAAELLKPFVGEHLPRQFGFTYSNMIEAAKAAAADGRISERFSELEIENTQQAGRLQLHLRGMMPSDELPDDPELCRALSHAIVVASKAHECARDQNLSHVSLWAHDAYDFSRNAADGDTELIRQLEDEYRSLHQIASADRWNHRTRVRRTPNGWRRVSVSRPWWKFWD